MEALVIVESPSKSKTIQKYLGKGYTVKASKGHIVDLPKSELGVDVEDGFNPHYIVTKRASLTELKKAYQGKDILILAVDPDREGEAIGWHIASKLGVITPSGKVKKGHNLQRIVFTSITKDAVNNAIENPREIDMNLVNAQQARRVLDRLVGYKLSPLLWKKIRFGLSAGRVQSVAVRMIVEREEERDLFKTQEYWSMNASFSTRESKDMKFRVSYANSENKDALGEEEIFSLTKIKGKKPDIQNEELIKNIWKEVSKGEAIVSTVETKKVKRNPKAPFTTSTLQQTASNRLGFSAKKTMTIAQKLYEQGFITYMRTDSTNFAQSAIDDVRKFVMKKYGKEYLPVAPNVYSKKAKVAQEAHEAIRPSNMSLVPSETNFETDEKKLYDLIWSRSVASQMSSAEIQTDEIGVTVSSDYYFSATSQKVIFPGYLQVYHEKVSEGSVPDMKTGQKVFVQSAFASQHFTQPPARFSEATLIKELEKYGIGRPSTYVPILSTITVRGYVEKQGKYFCPTDTGKIVTRLLKENFMNVVDYDFTANMENDLDNIANGQKDWVKMIGDFYFPFEKSIVEKDKIIDRETYTVLEDAPEEIKCPECGGKMKTKLGRYGRFYSCANWPTCKGILSTDGKSNEDIQNEAKEEKFLSIYLPAPITDKGTPYLLKRSKYGRFWAHPEYPKVKDIKSLEYTPDTFKKIYGDIPETSDGKKMVLKRGKFGEYWAHPEYPKIKEMQKVDKKQVQENKELLGIE